MTLTLFLVFFAACCTAAATGAMFPPGPWYERLNKPRWTPPDWLFPVAWTILYLSSAYAAARVGATGADKIGLALALWALQIALNTLWTPVFFGLQRIRSGMVVVVLLWLSVLLTLVSFWAIDRVAGALFVPYLIWVTVAAALNADIWRRNPLEVSRAA